MKKKLIIVLPVLLVLIGGGAAAYFFVLAPSPAKAAKKKDLPKITGTLFQLQPEFVVNLAGDHFGKVSIGLLLAKPPVLDTTAENPTLAQDPAVRAAITDDLSGLQMNRLVAKASRHALEAEILKDLQKTTDIDVTRVMFTDVVVQ